jgi:hypothetical protein
MIRELVHWAKNIYTTPSAEMLAMRELEDSKRRLLEAQTAREFADSMCKYREAQVKRLTAYLHNATDAM